MKSNLTKFKQQKTWNELTIEGIEGVVSGGFCQSDSLSFLAGATFMGKQFWAAGLGFCWRFNSRRDWCSFILRIMARLVNNL